MTKDHEIPWAPVRRLLKRAGVNLVAQETVEYLTEWIEDYIKDLAMNAKLVMTDHGRKTLYKADIKLALKLMGK